jgi:hypothetical protein
VLTRRFKKPAAAAGLPEINLHDVRHGYATAGRDAKIDWKALSRRIGHADVAFTMKGTFRPTWRPTAGRRTLAQLIIGSFLASTEVTDEVSGDQADGVRPASLANPLANHMQVGRSRRDQIVGMASLEPSGQALCDEF